MTTDFVTLVLSCSVLALIQLLAALPWLAAVDSRTFFSYLRRPESWVFGLIGVITVGIGAALFLENNTDRSTLAWYGGIYGSVLQAQVTADLFVLVLGLMLLCPTVDWSSMTEGKRWGLYTLVVFGSGALFGLLGLIAWQVYGLGDMWVVWLALLGGFFGLALILFLFPGRPKGAAVALSAFRESLRQPMFWLLFFVALVLMWLFPFLPYFTLGEDLKMVKELGYDLIMLVAVVFAVIAASSSISEEIEGRTAVTLMSKPISRRQFLLGKFLGIFLSALVMVTLLGWFLVMMFLFKEGFDPPIGGAKDRVADPAWVSRFVAEYVPEGEPAGLVRGVGLWFDNSGAVLPGLIIVSGQVMVLLAIAVALATRLPMVVNIPICIVFYFLGHLTPILISVSRGRGGAFRLIEFMAQVFDTVLPGLEHFSLGAVIVRDAPLPAGQFALYTSEVSLYALLYTAIALLFGLILFEDRDLA